MPPQGNVLVSEPSVQCAVSQYAVDQTVKRAQGLRRLLGTQQMFLHGRQVRKSLAVVMGAPGSYQKVCINEIISLPSSCYSS